MKTAHLTWFNSFQQFVLLKSQFSIYDLCQLACSQWCQLNLHHMATSQRLRGMFAIPSDAETEMWAVSVWQLHSNFLFGSGATTGWLISLHLPTGTHCTLMQYDCSTTNHPPTPGDVFQSIQMLITLHRQKRWAFAEWCKEQNADTAITSSKKDRSQQPACQHWSPDAPKSRAQLLLSPAPQVLAV